MRPKFARYLADVRPNDAQRKQMGANISLTCAQGSSKTLPNDVESGKMGAPKVRASLAQRIQKLDPKRAHGRQTRARSAPKVRPKCAQITLKANRWVPNIRLNHTNFN